jgi:hypothetical protein
VALSDIKPYLINQKEYWALKHAVQNKFVQNLNADRAEPSLLKRELKRVLEKSGNEDKLKLLLQNSIYNFKTDSTVVDADLRNRFGDSCAKWREFLATLLENYYGEATLELKKQKKSKDPAPQISSAKIFDHEDILKFFSKFKVKEEDKLVRLQLLYFQIPNMKTVRTMFKELNTDKFDHIGFNDDDFINEKEKICEEVVAEESDNFEYLNCFKFGIPPGVRFKFISNFVSLDCHPPAIKSGPEEQLDAAESEVMKFFFKNDVLQVCNETSFFAFDEMINELTGKLVTEKEVLFDIHETDSDQIFTARLPCRIIPSSFLTKHVGILTFFNKKKDKLYPVVKFMLKHHVSKLFDIRPVNSENIIGSVE